MQWRLGIDLGTNSLGWWAFRVKRDGNHRVYHLCNVAFWLRLRFRAASGTSLRSVWVGLTGQGHCIHWTGRTAGGG